MEDKCMFCGSLVPEGYLVCPACEQSILEAQKKTPPKKDNWLSRLLGGKRRSAGCGRTSDPK